MLKVVIRGLGNNKCPQLKVNTDFNVRVEDFRHRIELQLNTLLDVRCNKTIVVTRLLHKARMLGGSNMTLADANAHDGDLMYAFAREIDVNLEWNPSENKNDDDAKGVHTDDNLLLIKVVCARDLLPMDEWNSKSDPYVIIGSGANSARTSVINETLNPNWNEIFGFMNSKNLNVAVFDYDHLSDDDFLGSIDIDLSKISNNAVYFGPIERTFALTNMEALPTLAGTITLMLQRVPLSPKISPAIEELTKLQRSWSYYDMMQYNIKLENVLSSSRLNDDNDNNNNGGGGGGSGLHVEFDAANSGGDQRNEWHARIGKASLLNVEYHDKVGEKYYTNVSTICKHTQEEMSVYTIELWVRLNGKMCDNDGVCIGEDVCILEYADVKDLFSFQASNITVKTKKEYESKLPSIKIGEWNHIIVSYGKNVCCVYVNYHHCQILSLNEYINDQTSPLLSITNGACVDIALLRIYTRELNAHDVKELYFAKRSKYRREVEFGSFYSQQNDAIEQKGFDNDNDGDEIMSSQVITKYVCKEDVNMHGFKCGIGSRGRMISTVSYEHK